MELAATGRQIEEPDRNRAQRVEHLVVTDGADVTTDVSYVTDVTDVADKGGAARGASVTGRFTRPVTIWPGEPCGRRRRRS